ncbi:YrdB family protein [Oceanobacillus polygoni]|uniref:DUF2568 domain-containing protein n=1 Tax=Oceanobacillus polygoni TaxID=1235259 RepID=A0A9X1CDN1_9BACI|nr:YrdB family protein [Oceanobacillus polygoni]MBP2079226.1 hypothetical protein [Oceanobacillus polygoni]
MFIFQYALYAILFLLELVALIAFSNWGFQQSKGPFMKILFGIGTPLFVAIFWGMFLSPKAAITIPFSLQLLLQFILFALAALSLHATGKSGIAIVFFITFVISKLLILVIKRSN